MNLSLMRFEAGTYTLGLVTNASSDKFSIDY
jgi:hypothetical protein